VWHLGISPHWFDEHPESEKKVEELHELLAEEYEATREGFFHGVNRLLVLLQERAAFPPTSPPTRSIQTVSRHPGPANASIAASHSL
jgi:hypothetical protein